MAALAQSAVAKGDIYFTDGTMGKRHKAVDVVLTLTGQGTAANPIAASLFGLSTIVWARSFRQSDDSVILVASPSYDGSKLLLKAAGTNAPADFTGTFKGVVLGKE